MLRKKDELYSKLDIANLEEMELFKIISQNISLLERPIFETPKAAIIARPPELLNDFLMNHCRASNCRTRCRSPSPPLRPFPEHRDR